MILIWRGWGLLAVVALFPMLASCAGLATVEPFGLCLFAVLLSLVVAGAVCVYYGNRWNRPVVEHSFYFVPLQVWGWVYLALATLPAVIAFIGGVGVLTGILRGPNKPTPNGPLYLAVGGGIILCLVVPITYALVRSARSAPAEQEAMHVPPDRE